VSQPRIVPAGDSALIVEFDNRIDVSVNARVLGLASRLQSDPVTGVRDVVPTYRSVAVYFDPVRTSHDALMARLQREASLDIPAPAATRESVGVPVCYGGEFGPDLPAVASFGGITEAEAVDRHTALTYHVFMLGFAPGFAYMGVVDERIATPRRETPRLRVLRGSVGIAGRQTGVYPAESPGGWQIIGRTPIRPFDPARAEPFLLRPGDSVRFRAIDRAEFDRLTDAAP
jgi:KipI family sensor histidine kinase inhibitor